MFKKGTIIFSRDNKYKGYTTGGVRPCSLEGCRGHRIAVRWEEGKLTYPCTKDIEYNGKGWRIL